MNQSRTKATGESARDKKIREKLRLPANNYIEVVDKRVLFIYTRNKTCGTYDGYEVHHGVDNFIHLAGFKRKPKEPGVKRVSASEFLYKSADGSIDLSTVDYAECYNAVSDKLDVLPDLLNYKHIRLYRIGKHDIATPKNRFDVCISTNEGVMGFRKDSNFPRNIPVTALKQTLSYYCTKENEYKVIAILMKTNANSRYYNLVLNAPKTGLSIEPLPEYIKKKLPADWTMIKK